MQEINFYNVLPKPLYYDIRSQRARMILVNWAGLLALFFILQCLYGLFERSHLFYLSYKEKSMTQQIQALLQTSPKIQLYDQLTRTIRDDSEKINYQSAFIQEILKYYASKAQFYPSRYFKELAAVATPQVWLTQINLLNQGQQISLEGMALSASRMMQFVLLLEKESQFRDKLFKQVTASDTRNHMGLTFTLNTLSQP